MSALKSFRTRSIEWLVLPDWYLQTPYIFDMYLMGQIRTFIRSDLRAECLILLVQIVVERCRRVMICTPTLWCRAQSANSHGSFFIYLLRVFFFVVVASGCLVLSLLYYKPTKYRLLKNYIKS